jgi:hypothetical protein
VYFHAQVRMGAVLTFHTGLTSPPPNLPPEGGGTFVGSLPEGEGTFVFAIARRSIAYLVLLTYLPNLSAHCNHATIRDNII